MSLVKEQQMINNQENVDANNNLNSSATSSLAGSISQYEKKYLELQQFE